MKKNLFRWLVTAMMLLILFPFQVVQACTGFIIGKNLTTDGSTLYGRTEDLEPNHNKNFVVRERKNNKAGDKFVDETNGFSFDLPAVSYKYTAVPDVTPEQGVFDEAGFNEEGVSISATVSASANDDIQKKDPYVKDGIAESAITSVVLPPTLISFFFGKLNILFFPHFHLIFFHFFQNSSPNLIIAAFEIS